MRADAQGIGGGLLDARAVLPLYTLVPRTDQEIERLIGTVRVVLFALAGDVLCAEFRLRAHLWKFASIIKLKNRM